MYPPPPPPPPPTGTADPDCMPWPCTKSAPQESPPDGAFPYGKRTENGSPPPRLIETGEVSIPTDETLLTFRSSRGKVTFETEGAAVAAATDVLVLGILLRRFSVCIEAPLAPVDIEMSGWNGCSPPAAPIRELLSKLSSASKTRWKCGLGAPFWPRLWLAPKTPVGPCDELGGVWKDEALC